MKSKVEGVLLVSNGYGEDAMGALLARELKKRRPEMPVSALPIVGPGRAYRVSGVKDAGVKTVGPSAEMPSGGFVREGIGPLLKDLRSGLLGLTVRQIATLRREARGRLVICVGDFYVLWLAATFTGSPIIFLPTAKSEYIRGHYGFEIRLMKRRCLLVFPRDEITSEALRKAGVPARFAGNLMMDMIGETGIGFGIPYGVLRIGILPGSRGDEPIRNSGLLLREAAIFGDLAAKAQLRTEGGCRCLAGDDGDRSADSARLGVWFLMALAGGTDETRIVALAEELGWTTEPDSVSAIGDSSVAVENTVPAERAGVLKVMRRAESVLLITRGRFGDVLRESDLVFGMAGTANEQAAGMGKPVVAFPGDGPQFTRKFLLTQKKLLGDAVSIASPQPGEAAREALQILRDPAQYSRMSASGIERMGSPGASDRLIAEILELVAPN